jgi:hypothetical protein
LKYTSIAPRPIIIAAGETWNYFTCYLAAIGRNSAWLTSLRQPSSQQAALLHDSCGAEQLTRKYNQQSYRKSRRQLLIPSGFGFADGSIVFSAAGPVADLHRLKGQGLLVRSAGLEGKVGLAEEGIDEVGSALPGPVRFGRQVMVD